MTSKTPHVRDLQKDEALASVHTYCAKHFFTRKISGGHQAKRRKDGKKRSPEE
jgi:hypothetical protein